MKYYEIMELECNTRINNRGVGADFYYCTSENLDEITKQIESRENNYEVDEISKEEYDQEFEKNKRKNFYLATGH